MLIVKAQMHIFQEAPSISGLGRGRIRTWLFWVLLLGQSACGDVEDTLVGHDEIAQSKILVQADQWRPTRESIGPMFDHRPDEVRCPPGAWYPEDGALEVQTGFCNYFEATQQILEPVKAGETIGFVLWHGALTASEPAEAHVAILIDHEIIWETRVAIPRQADIFEGSWVTDRPLDEDTQITLHLHNHGYNTWTFQPLSVVESRASF